MPSAEVRNSALAFLRKAEEFYAAAKDDFDLERLTPAAGCAIHAGISAKDSIATFLTGTTGRGKDHAVAAQLGTRPEAARAEKALRDLISAKTDVGYTSRSLPTKRVEVLLRRAEDLVELAREIVR